MAAARVTAALPRAATPARASAPPRPAAPAPRPGLVPTAPPAIRLRADNVAPGELIAPSVRLPIERSFGADLRAARVRTDAAARGAARSLGARAFALGNQIFLGPGERPTDLGLMAHEAAHVVQQRGGATPQPWHPTGGDHYEAEARRASAAVLGGNPFDVRERTAGPRAQGLFGFDPLDFIAREANLIPGFRMFTIVLGVNPVNMTPVDRGPANILRATIEFMPGGGLITRALDAYGILDKVGTWVAEQLRALGMVGGAIKQAITAFIGGLGLSDVGSPGAVWDRAKRIFTDPIDRILWFVKGLVAGVIEIIKDAILRPIAELAAQTRGWDLLTAVLGKNPITGEPVPRTPEVLIGGFMKLIGQEDVWEKMKNANAIPRAWAWFQGAMAGLMGFVNQIPTLAVNAFKSLVLEDLVLLPRALGKIAAVFGNFVGEFFSWAGAAVWKLLEIVFDVVSPGALGYIKRTGAALKSILKNPLPFVGNLVRAAKLGFQNFGGNFLTHLKAGLIEWLTGSLPGIYVPRSFEIGEIAKFALSVLGLTWQNIRQKLVKAVGETAVKAMETGFDIVKTLVTQGPAAAWEQIKGQLTNLKDMVIGGITDFVVDMVVKKAIPALIAMFIPGAGFISAILSIYETVMTFVQRISRIVQVVTAFIDSIVNIAAGNIGAAAARVERVLGGLLSLSITLLASLARMGRVSDKIMAVFNKLRAPFDRALDFLIGWIVKMAKKLFAKAFAPKDAGGPDERTAEEKRRAVHEAIVEAMRVGRHRGVTREALERALPGIARRFRLRALTTVEHGGRGYRVHGELNPTEDSDDLPDVLTVERAVARVRQQLAAKKTEFEISVATQADARTVIAQAFPTAREAPPPTPGSGFRSQVDARNIEAFRELRRRALAFHVDVQPYRVGEIRTRLAQEVRDVTALGAHARAEMKYHRDNPMWSARNQDALRATERNLEAANGRLGNLEEITADLARHVREWQRLEVEGVLYGHATVPAEESRHRTNPHVNVAGPVRVTHRVETFELFIKVAIYVRSA